MTHTIITIHPDGMITSLYDKPKLELLQGEVGGYIQQIPWFKKFQSARVRAYVDEDGISKRLKPNPIAGALSTAEAQRTYKLGQARGEVVLGPLVLVIRGMFALNKEDLPK